VAASGGRRDGGAKSADCTPRAALRHGADRGRAGAAAVSVPPVDATCPRKSDV